MFRAMIRRIVCILIPLLFALDAFAVESRTDTSGFAALDAKLEEYLYNIARCSIPEQQEECDFLIESAPDSLVRQHIALKLYDHYLNSKFMGVESVAVYLLDKWFFTGRISMKSDIDLMNAHIYADFNRASLLGETAQSLLLKDEEGNDHEVTPARSKRFSVIYFYDTGCPNCLLTSTGMDLMFRGDCTYWQVDVYPVYSGADGEAWRKYRGTHFTGYNVPVTNLWDPELRSDFQRKYGVLQTPMLFLVDDKGEIVGRGLDAEALKILLDSFFPGDIQYGGEESDALYERLMSELSPDDVFAMVDYLADKYLGKDSGIRDTLIFKEMTGDFLYYLASRRDGVAKRVEDLLIDSDILGRPDVWRTADDSVKVIGFARLEKEFLGRTPEGRKLPKIKVLSELRTASRPEGVTRKWRIDRLGAECNYILFYSPDCANCREYLEKSGSMAGKDAGVLLVNMDRQNSEDRKTFEKLMDTFDLTVLPFMISTDKKGRVMEKYIQPN